MIILSIRLISICDKNCNINSFTRFSLEHLNANLHRKMNFQIYLFIYTNMNFMNFI